MTRHDDTPQRDKRRDTSAKNATKPVTITEASRVLGLSIRSVQRRLDTGDLEAVSVSGKRMVRLPSNATKQTIDDTPKGATARQNDAPNATLAVEREAELREEVRFLRSLVEQQQRDGAEMRAAVREMTKALALNQTKALPASSDVTSEPQNEPVSFDAGNYRTGPPKATDKPKPEPRPLWQLILGIRPKP